MTMRLDGERHTQAFSISIWSSENYKSDLPIKMTRHQIGLTGNNVIHMPIIELDISNITHSTLIGGVMRITYA